MAADDAIVSASIKMRESSVSTVSSPPSSASPSSLSCLMSTISSSTRAASRRFVERVDLCRCARVRGDVCVESGGEAGVGADACVFVGNDVFRLFDDVFRLFDDMFGVFDDDSDDDGAFRAGGGTWLVSVLVDFARVELVLAGDGRADADTTIVRPGDCPSIGVDGSVFKC